MNKNAVSQHNGMDTKHNSSEYDIVSNSAYAMSAWLEYHF